MSLRKRISKRGVPMQLKRASGSHIDDSKEDISIRKLVFYNLLFFIPIVVSLIISFMVGRLLTSFFQTSVRIVVEILMFFFTLVIFAVIIPFIRKRENVQGIRFALIGIWVMGIAMTIPSLIAGQWGWLLTQITYLSTYLLLTFIYVPEVLGMTSNIEEWFKQHRQLLVIGVYVAIVMMYISGFAYTYYEIEITNPRSFIMSDTAPSYGAFLYYSIISFATVGYGDITPVSTAARFVAGLETVVALIMNVIFIAILLVYISGFQSLQQKKEDLKLHKEEQEMVGIEEKEMKDIRRLKELEKLDISHISSKEQKDFRHLLDKIKEAKKRKIKKKILRK